MGERCRCLTWADCFCNLFLLSFRRFFSALFSWPSLFHSLSTLASPWFTENKRVVFLRSCACGGNCSLDEHGIIHFCCHYLEFFFVTVRPRCKKNTNKTRTYMQIKVYIDIYITYIWIVCLPILLFLWVYQPFTNSLPRTKGDCQAAKPNIKTCNDANVETEFLSSS